MKFATELQFVKTLSYCDRPLLEHWKQIDRITLTVDPSDEGDMFDGTITHWIDNYFSNFTVEGAIAFAEDQGVKIKFYGQDFLMVWQDETDEFVTWLAVPVAIENLAAFLETELDKAITLREVLLREDLVHPLYQVKANTFVYDVIEGEPIQLVDIGEEYMPLDGSYCHIETYVAWEARKNAGRLGTVLTTSTEPVSLGAPDDLAAAPEVSHSGA